MLFRSTAAPVAVLLVLAALLISVHASEKKTPPTPPPQSAKPKRALSIPQPEVDAQVGQPRTQTTATSSTGSPSTLPGNTTPPSSPDASLGGDPDAPLDARPKLKRMKTPQTIKRDGRVIGKLPAHLANLDIPMLKPSDSMGSPLPSGPHRSSSSSSTGARGRSSPSSSSAPNSKDNSDDLGSSSESGEGLWSPNMAPEAEKAKYSELMALPEKDFIEGLRQLTKVKIDKNCMPAAPKVTMPKEQEVPASKGRKRVSKAVCGDSSMLAFADKPEKVGWHWDLTCQNSCSTRGWLFDPAQFEVKPGVQAVFPAANNPETYFAARCQRACIAQRENAMTLDLVYKSGHVDAFPTDYFDAIGKGVPPAQALTEYMHQHEPPKNKCPRTPEGNGSTYTGYFLCTPELLANDDLNDRLPILPPKSPPAPLKLKPFVHPPPPPKPKVKSTSAPAQLESGKKEKKEKKSLFGKKPKAPKRASLETTTVDTPKIPSGGIGAPSGGIGAPSGGVNVVGGALSMFADGMPKTTASTTQVLKRNDSGSK